MKKRIPGLLDNITDCGDTYQIEIGRRAGLQTKHCLKIPKTLNKKNAVDVLRHINNVVHEAVNTGQRETRADMQRQFKNVIGID